MSEETKMVLQMLAEGKISADQAANLLQALSVTVPKTEASVLVPRSTQEDLHEAARKARQEARDASRAAREELREAKQTAKEAVRDAKERLREEKAALRERLRGIRENTEDEIEKKVHDLQDELESRLESLEEIEETELNAEDRIGRRTGPSFSGLGTMLGGLWGFGRSFSSEETKEGSFKGAEIYEIAVHGVNGRVTVEPSDKEEWRLTATKTLNAASQKDADELAADMYTLLHTERSLVIQARKVFGQSRTVHFHLYLPKSLIYNLDVRSTNGSVQVGNLNTRRLRASTTNGKVEVDTHAHEMDLVSTNGRVELRGCADRVVCRTVNGRIVVDCPEPVAGTMELSTVNGRVIVRVKRSSGLGVRFTGSTVSGGVSADLFDQQVLTDERRTVGRKLSVQTRGEFAGWLTITARSVHGPINLTQL